jgi:hypothetical protein
MMPSHDDEWLPLQFIGDEISVEFDRERLPLKKPTAPDRFRWAESVFHVAQVISAWREFERKGRFARNMQPHNLRAAAKRGSWGVGRFYFRVEVRGGRVFDLYYDRAPDDAADRLGHWFLFREMRRRHNDQELQS